jgi:hypothetical protein
MNLMVGVNNKLQRIFVRGHPDGLLKNGFVEVKKVTKTQWGKAIKEELDYIKSWPWQFSFYWHWYNLNSEDREFDALFVIGKWEDNDVREISIWDSEDFKDGPPRSYPEIVKRVNLIEGLIANEHYMDVKCDPMYPCQWFAIHDDDADEPPTRLSAEAWLADACTQLRESQDKTRAATAIIEVEKNLQKRLQGSIKAWLDMNGEGGAEKGIIKVEVDGVPEFKWEFEYERKKYWREGYTVEGGEIDSLTV